jgi:hypothetical protein
LGTVITTTGKSVISGRLIDLLDKPQYLGVGTGAGSAAVGDTALFSETGTRVPCALSIRTTDTADDTVYCLATWTNFGSIVGITNVGLFTALSGGTLVAKADGVGQTLDTNEGLTVSFSIKITGACP